MTERASKTEALLADLRAKPADEALRERAARALDVEGRAADAAGVLRDGLVNLTAHSTSPLPCLCKRCLDPALAAFSHDGMDFRREFAVAQGRVLYFWAPAELMPQRENVSRSVQAAMKLRLARSRKGGVGRVG